MYTAMKKEQFSIAYVCALAAQLGFNHFDPKVDDESVDMEFIGNYPKSDPTIRIWNPHLEIQLKCTKNGPQSPSPRDHGDLFWRIYCGNLGLKKFPLPFCFPSFQ